MRKDSICSVRINHKDHFTEIFFFPNGCVSFVPSFFNKPLVIDRGARTVRNISEEEKQLIKEYKRHDCE